MLHRYPSKVANSRWDTSVTVYCYSAQKEVTSTVCTEPQMHGTQQDTTAGKVEQIQLLQKVQSSTPTTTSLKSHCYDRHPYLSKALFSWEIASVNVTPQARIYFVMNWFMQEVKYYFLTRISLNKYGPCVELNNFAKNDSSKSLQAYWIYDVRIRLQKCHHHVTFIGNKFKNGNYHNIGQVSDYKMITVREFFCFGWQWLFNNSLRSLFIRTPQPYGMVPFGSSPYT